MALYTIKHMQGIRTEGADAHGLATVYRGDAAGCLEYIKRAPNFAERFQGGWLRVYRGKTRLGIMALRRAFPAVK